MDDQPKSKIYIFIGDQWASGDLVVYALAEDGTGLASHLCSSRNFIPHDMGATSEWKHEAYTAHYPNGWELEWVEDCDTHEGFQAAYALNQAQQERGEN